MKLLIDHLIIGKEKCGDCYMYVSGRGVIPDGCGLFRVDTYPEGDPNRCRKCKAAEQAAKKEEVK